MRRTSTILKLAVFGILVCSVDALAQVRSAAPVKRNVSVSILFQHTNMPKKMELWQVPSYKILDVGETKTTPLTQESPFLRRIPDTTSVRRGEFFYYAQVITNDSDTPMFFYASPHTMEPEESAMGYRLVCIRNNVIYTVPPKSRWYRIGLVSLDRTFIGNKLAISHTLFGLTSKEIVDRKLQGLLDR